MIRLLFTSIVAFAMATLVGGCSCSPEAGKYNIEVTLDPTLMTPGTKTFPPVSCQVVGVSTRAECDQQLSTAVSTQIDRDVALLKANHVVSFDLSQSKDGSRTIESTDPIWAEWKTPRFIIVTANIPNMKPGEGGNLKDPRRIYFSTNTCRWKKSGGTIHIRVLRDGIKPDPTEITPEPDHIGPDGF